MTAKTKAPRARCMAPAALFPDDDDATGEGAAPAPSLAPAIIGQGRGETPPPAAAPSPLAGGAMGADGGQAETPRPCPQCWQGKPCGGRLRPVIGKPWLAKCDKCGRAVYVRAAKREGKR